MFIFHEMTQRKMILRLITVTIILFSISKCISTYLILLPFLLPSISQVQAWNYLVYSVSCDFKDPKFTYYTNLHILNENTDFFSLSNPNSNIWKLVFPVWSIICQLTIIFIPLIHNVKLMLCLTDIYCNEFLYFGRKIIKSECQNTY